MSSLGLDTVRIERLENGGWLVVVRIGYQRGNFVIMEEKRQVFLYHHKEPEYKPLHRALDYVRWCYETYQPAC